MNIKENLPLCSYHCICDEIEYRISNLQSLQAYDKEYEDLKNELFVIRDLLEVDTKEKIRKDIEKLLEIVKKKISNES